MTWPKSDLKLLISAARAAAEIAKPYWQKSPKTWEKPDAAGPVTEADLAVNTMLQNTLCSARPDYGWLSEESEDGTERLSRNRVFIIDPIDGTRSFIAGEKTWAHSLAIAENGRIVAGVVYVPMLGRLYHARSGAAACLNGETIRVSGRGSVVDATVLAARPNFEPRHWHGGKLPVSRQFRPSLAYRMALVAQGRFDAMLTLRDTWEWDVAAGTLIAAQAGAHVTQPDGAAPVFNNPTPKLPGLIGATPLVHGELLSRLIWPATGTA